MDLNHYVTEISRYKELAEELPEDNPGALLKKIDILTKCLVLVGDVSAECDRLYKRVHVRRDTEFAQAYIDADKPKKERAELATKEIRTLEAESYGRMQQYRNEFESMQETLHGLRLKMRVNFADGYLPPTRH
jgi:predicted enzyme involved in methoxymalonyl-ACP biosynthesis